MKTILCVDDDGWVLDMLKNSLEERGYRVLITTNTAVAPSCLKFETVDLVLLDLNMPTKDGFEVYREIQATQHVPVLFVSGCVRTFEQRVGELRDDSLGRFDFLPKPFSLTALCDKPPATG